MGSRTTRTRVLFALTILFTAMVIKIFGAQYIWPLPVWLRLVIAAVCFVVIAMAAIYSRRQAGRPAAEP